MIHAHCVYSRMERTTRLFTFHVMTRCWHSTTARRASGGWCFPLRETGHVMGCRADEAVRQACHARKQHALPLVQRQSMSGQQERQRPNLGHIMSLFELQKSRFFGAMGHFSLSSIPFGRTSRVKPLVERVDGLDHLTNRHISCIIEGK